jgi:hypothetical protein
MMTRCAHLDIKEATPMKTCPKILLVAAGLAGCLSAMAVAPAVQAQNAQAQDPNNICLNPQDIKFTQAKDSRTIVFQMRDGSAWVNTLVAPCPNLVSTGSAWTQTVHSDVICANKQQITLIQTGNVCRLGTFTRVK